MNIKIFLENENTEKIELYWVGDIDRVTLHIVIKNDYEKTTTKNI